MTGGLGQSSRVMAQVDREYREGRGIGVSPVPVSGPAELPLAPGEDLQCDIDEAPSRRSEPLPNAAWLAFAFVLAAIAAHHAWWSAGL